MGHRPNRLIADISEDSSNFSRKIKEFFKIYLKEFKNSLSNKKEIILRLDLGDGIDFLLLNSALELKDNLGIKIEVYLVNERELTPRELNKLNRLNKLL